MTCAAPDARFTGINRLNVTDRSAIHTAGTQTLPRKVVCGTVEIIMHFKSTASFTNHGNTPFVDCEMTRLMIESSMYLLPWIKHEHCHAGVSYEVVENSAPLASHLAVDPHRRMGQLVRIHRRPVANHFDRHIDDAARNLLRRVCPNDVHGTIL